MSSPETIHSKIARTFSQLMTRWQASIKGSGDRGCKADVWPPWWWGYVVDLGAMWRSWIACVLAEFMKQVLRFFVKSQLPMYAEPSLPCAHLRTHLKVVETWLSRSLLTMLTVVCPRPWRSWLWRRWCLASLSPSWANTSPTRVCLVTL